MFTGCQVHKIITFEHELITSQSLFVAKVCFAASKLQYLQGKLYFQAFHPKDDNYN